MPMGIGLGISPITGFGGARSPLQRPSCVFWTKAKNSNGVLVDGTGKHAIQHGSAAGADSNDPLWLPYGGTQYCYFPGGSGNSASSPDTAAVSVTGDLDLHAFVAAADWTPGAVQYLISKGQASGTYSYWLSINTAGTLRLEISLLGSVVSTANSSVAPTIADGADLWVRAKRASASGTVTFYTSPDGSAWTQLGTTQSTSAGALFDGTALLELGCTNNTNLFQGKFYRARIYSGFSDAGGTMVFDANFANAAEPFATFTESSTNAATVTINRSASGRKSAVVDRDLYLLGTDDYFEIADADDLDFALTDSFTIAVLVRAYSPTNASVIAAKKQSGSAPDVGYRLIFSSTNRALAEVSDGTNAPSGQPANGSLPSGVASLAALTRGGGQVSGYAGGFSGSSTDTTTATLANAQALRIGRYSSSGTTFSDMEFLGAAVFREPLSAADLALVKAALLG